MSSPKVSGTVSLPLLLLLLLGCSTLHANAAVTTVLSSSSSWKFWDKFAISDLSWVTPGFGDGTWASGVLPAGVLRCHSVHPLHSRSRIHVLSCARSAAAVVD